MYVATIYPAQHEQYQRELPQLLGALPGAQSLSEPSKMAAALEVRAVARYEQSLIEQELCAIAHGFLGSRRSTWTANVELQRASFNRPSMMFGKRSLRSPPTTAALGVGIVGEYAIENGTV